MKSFPLLLDGFPRCGSTTLARLLSLHPEIDCCLEPFHPKRFGGEFNRLALQAGTVRPALNLLAGRWSGLKHVWEPGTGWPFKEHPELNDDLVSNVDVIISLRRRNLLRQIVSMHISKHLRFWIGTREEFRQHLDSACLPPLSVANAAKFLEEALFALERRDHLLRSLRSKQLVFYYEDFFNLEFDQQIIGLNRLFIELGRAPINDYDLTSLAHPFLDQSAYKWADNEVYDRVPGIRLIDEQIGSDLTGRIFDSD